MHWLLPRFSFLTLYLARMMMRLSLLIQRCFRTSLAECLKYQWYWYHLRYSWYLHLIFHIQSKQAQPLLIWNQVLKVQIQGFQNEFLSRDQESIEWLQCTTKKKQQRIYNNSVFQGFFFREIKNRTTIRLLC